MDFKKLMFCFGFFALLLSVPPPPLPTPPQESNILDVRKIKLCLLFWLMLGLTILSKIFLRQKTLNLLFSLYSFILPPIHLLIYSILNILIRNTYTRTQNEKGTKGLWKKVSLSFTIVPRSPWPNKLSHFEDPFLIFPLL